ncbi:MAG: AIPR family protein [Sulfuricaulis sp.]|uniref:AIPR family protein n=1 Tax=Sulfuricaulis sp. TaxID=2003553 RepID=UPI0034A58A3A
MPTLLDWSNLNNKVKSYSDLYDCENESSALAYIVLEYLLDLTPSEIEDSLTDGGMDRGVDAVFVDDRDGKNIVHIFQFKYVQTFEKSKNNFPGKELDKLLSFISDVLNKSQELQKSCNPLLWNKVREIWSAIDRPKVSFEVHFCANMESLANAEKKRANDSLDRYKSFQVRHHTLESISNLFIEKRTPRINRAVRLVDLNYFERSDGNIRGLITSVTAEELVKIIEDDANPHQVRLDIFNDNVRVYLTSKNRINEKIIKTALSDQNTEFWYLNNGITITCDSFSYQPGTRAPVVELQNVQIVNGGQTSNALFEAYKQKPESVKNVLVLVRIYETKERRISTAIAESTNSQTPIKTRDLRSNDEIQKKLEQGFHENGLFYERKARQFSDQPKLQRVDALTAAQAYLAYTMELPEVAKKDRGRIFGDLYDSIFNDDITPQKLHIPLQIYSIIDKKKRELQQKIKHDEEFNTDHLYLIDGAYHVLHAISAMCQARKYDYMDLKQATSLIDEAVEIVSDVVNAEYEEDPAFSFNRFFKDALTKNKIRQQIISVYEQGKLKLDV